MYEIQNGLSKNEKLEILADAAKYDVACTSSGSDRRGEKGKLGNAKACGICHSFASDGRCISLLKILMTNHCIYDCKYCVNRLSNDIKRTAFTPDEICEITVEFYKRNYIEGLFLSSGVMRSPSYTMEKMIETLILLRSKYKFNGYIHVKMIPGVSDDLLSMMGYLADRVSVNMELATEEGLKNLAPNKTQATIFEPMGKISNTISAHRLAIGKDAKFERSFINQHLDNSIFSERKRIEDRTRITSLALPSELANLKRKFAPAGQSTQIIIGATKESDYTLLQTTQKLYESYDLRRVFYSAYIPINDDSALPALGTAVPLLREHRLYQADWLLRYYGFQCDELLSEDRPDFNEAVDPKCDWALRHLECFPVDVQTASYDLLLRVPGIGPKSAVRICQARRYGRLDYDILKRIGVVLKRAHYFIVCSGKQMYKTPIEENYIFRGLTDTNRKENWRIAHGNEQYEQLSLFDMGMT